MRRFILPALTSLATLAACQQPVPAQDAPPSDPSQSSQPTGQTMPLPIAVTDETTRYALVPGNNRFAWSLYDALGAKPGNAF